LWIANTAAAPTTRAAPATPSAALRHLAMVAAFLFRGPV